MSIGFVEFTLSFKGNDSDNSQIDFYDVSQALVGFQRSLALTTHLVLNDKVITQSPSLKGARIIALPPEEGSWKITAAIGLILTGAYHISTAPKDTPLGNLISSAYDYVISETMGFHVDYSKTLGQQYEELKKKDGNQIPILEQHRFDSVIEKCEFAIKEMHRPIVQSETATRAQISSSFSDKNHPFKNGLNRETYDFINYTNEGVVAEEVEGVVSSFNLNTYKGRIFVPEEGRPIPFLLAEQVKNAIDVGKTIQSLTMNAKDRFNKGSNSGTIRLKVIKYTSRSGRLKSYLVLEVLK
ncbi:MAG: hypothetical protein KGI37_08925 [Alphaproteobacteria bacterium]|nr:hypothetical protein [Alphaproteobacteria bacterium]